MSKKVYKKQSNIPNAGFGLFAGENIKKGNFNLIGASGVFATASGVFATASGVFATASGVSATGVVEPLDFFYRSFHNYIIKIYNYIKKIKICI